VTATSRAGPISWSAIGAFARARWGFRFADRDALLRYQERRLGRFLRETLPRAPFYRTYAGQPLAALPIVDKAAVLADFAAFNTRGVTLERALAVALEAERSRDFRPTLDGLTVGLSSGTSGTRGVFLVSPGERARWAGTLLARLLSRDSLRRLLDPRRPPLRVAFFLRANSNLYQTVGSRRLDFAFHDLLEPLDRHLERLSARPPDILVAPPTVLHRLAEARQEGALRIAPRQVISVAEVLEADDARAALAAFGEPVQQVYQCTEGFLGASCAAGRIHLNEELVHVEPEWLDAEHRRFQPIVTDFSRTAQLVVRYRLDDVLLQAEGPCPCGRPTRSLEAIEGRADDVLWLEEEAAEHQDAEWRPVFPDLVRRAFAVADPEGRLKDYRVEQRGEEWCVRLDLTLRSAASQELGREEDSAGGGRSASAPWEASRGAVEAAVRKEIEGLAGRLGLRRPAIRFEPWRQDSSLPEKRRRIRCLVRPPAAGSRP
jgi:putative adenylate-forming enzyme